MRIEQLEWENKGIAEWRNEWQQVTQQLAAANGRVERMQEALKVARKFLYDEGIYPNTVKQIDAAMLSEKRE